ncbi:MAG TPA: multiubiquitin domain-containing protein [Thiobacillus sp.]
MSNNHSDQEHGHTKTYSIIVNGRPREVPKHKLTYQEVVRLAFPDDQPNQDMLYTVAYANPHGKDGTLVDGQDVTIKNGMSFNVSKTSRS